MIENLHLYRQYHQISVSYLFAIQIKNSILCLKFITNLYFWGQFQWLNIKLEIYQPLSSLCTVTKIALS
jgi:hypothetical protein